ncbi:MAG: FtsX-like permease family protein [Gammaproteobacteria bacterium]|nr:FtsX-like permease family protein [Gammaproteobacteria bacterium]
MNQFNKIISLSFRDYSHEWRMSGCFVLALASVLAPMMILFGLKFGIVSSMITGLIENPSNREIRAVGSGRYEQTWFDEYAGRKDIAFIIPKTRSLAATIQLKSDKAGRIYSTELFATAANDPLLKDLETKPQGFYQVILSDTIANKLNIEQGDRIDGSLVRQFKGKRERVHIDLQVIDVAPAHVMSRNVAFVSLDLLLATESFKDGRAVAELNWSGNVNTEALRVYPSFRMYARSIGNVEKLVNELEQEGINVKANIAEIKTVQSIDQNLSIIFWIIACVGAVGFSFSLGASLWANVDRKRKELSILRLVGFQGGKIILFPVLQSMYTGLLGWLLAVLIYLVAEQTINQLLAPNLEIEQVICYLLPQHFFWALGLTMFVAATAAILGGIRASRIEPSDGLRDI